MTSLIAVDDRPAVDAAGDDVVRLDGVSVRYRIPLERYVSLKEYFVRWKVRPYMEHLALDAIDLTVQRGEVLGVIGRNGAGKTTLLNVIARVLHPTTGRIRIRGEVAALIDLLSGFHPELSGRENVFLRGALLGVSRRVVATSMESIAEFAEIGRFFDAPLRTYSAGMIVRLAFAVATSVPADVLVIDEALGVGDAQFQEKCAERIAEYRRRGVTFIIVSHDVLRLAAMCDRILWLDSGRPALLDHGVEVVKRYLAAQH